LIRHATYGGVFARINFREGKERKIAVKLPQLTQVEDDAAEEAPKGVSQF
jgi:hypothetical protein